MLEDISQLTNVTTLDGVISISGNNLATLNGLNNLQTIGSSCIISVTQLQTLSALSSLTAIGGQFLLNNNDSLVNLTGLENLSSIGDKLTITHNDSLTSLEALLNLVEIGSSLRVSNNPELESLYGLDNIDPETISGPFNENDLVIINNGNLTNCSVESICDLLELPSTSTFIEFNDVNCDSEAEIEVACSTVPVKWMHQPNVSHIDGHNKITWTVANQINNEKLEIEFRSEKGYFRKLGELNGHGTATR